MSINRAEVYNKFNGHCGYCGCELIIKQMQVDHIFPVHLKYYFPERDHDRTENLMPSCQPCNIHKGGMLLEDWRRLLGRQVSMLQNDARFKRALKFGQISIHEKIPIVFYFER